MVSEKGLKLTVVVVLTLIASGYASLALDPHLTIESTAKSPILSLENATITVKVTDGISPVENAFVQFTPEFGTVLPDSGYTDREGKISVIYTSASVSERQVYHIYVSASKIGYASASESIEVEILPLQVLSLSVSIEPATIITTESAELKIRVTNGTHPVPNATLGFISEKGEIFPPIGLTNSNGEFITEYISPLTNETQVFNITVIASKYRYIPDYNLTEIKVIPVPGNLIKVLVLDPDKNIIVRAGNFVFKRNSTFWEEIRKLYQDIFIYRVEPTENISEIFKLYYPRTIVLSENLLKYWELNENKNYEALKTFTENGGGLVITHATFFDLGIPRRDELIAASYHLGLYDEEDEYTVEYGGLCTLSGLGLFPIYEKIKLVVADVIEEVEKNVYKTPIVSSIIRNTPFFIPYVPFNRSMVIEIPDSPLLYGIKNLTIDTRCPICNITNSSADCYLTNDSRVAPCTAIGWQLEYPELIAIKALEGLEIVVNKTGDLLILMVKQYNEVHNGTLPTIEESDIEKTRGILLYSIKLMKNFFRAMLEARNNLPYISVTIPAMNFTVYNGTDWENRTFGERTVTIVIPREIAEKIIPLLKPAKIVAYSLDYRAAILSFESVYHRAVYFTFRPETKVNPTNLRLMYNAINWTKDKPEEIPTILDLILSNLTKTNFDKALTIMEELFKEYARTSFVTAKGNSSLVITLENKAKLIVLLTYNTGHLKATVISPSGEIFISESNGTGVEITEIDFPEDGNWTIVVTAEDIEAVQESYYLEIRTKNITDEECISDSECAFDEICHEGACIVLDCDDNNICTLDWVENHTCIYKVNESCCLVNKDCGSNEKCGGDNQCVPLECNDSDPCTIDYAENHECINLVIENCCKSDKDCNTTSKCEANKCVKITCDDQDICTKDLAMNHSCYYSPIEGCCKSDSDCKDKYFCKENKCVLAKCNDSDICTRDVVKEHKCYYEQIVNCCKSDSECKSNEVCNTTVNRCIPLTCNDSNVCTKDVVSNHSCVFEPIEDCCLQDEQCDDNNASTTDKCTNNKCSYIFEFKCSGDKDCKEDQFCKGGKCFNKKGEGENCTSDNECLSNYCKDNVCKKKKEGVLPGFEILGLLISIGILRRK